MKELYTTLLLVYILPAAMLPANPDNQVLLEVENKVNALFKDLERISNTDTDANAISKIKYEFESYFKSADQNCPNEFKNIWPQNPDATSKKVDIRPARYFDWFYQFFRDPEYHNYSFSFITLNSCIVKEPEFQKNERPAKLAQVVIQKVYSHNSNSIVFNDTLVVGLEEMKIRAWANTESKHSIGYFGGDVLGIEQLKVSAALAYDCEQYYKAYQIYQTIINKFPKDGDSYYHMAIMLYKKDYGSGMSKKNRRMLILDYLDKAIRYGSYSTSKCADNMKYWITC